MEGMVSLNSFWNKKQVFMTGHTGFKGAWLTFWLQKMGANITGYSLPPPTQPNLFETLNLSSEMRDIQGDVRDFENLKQSIASQGPEIIFHMAAQPLVRRSYNHTLETYSTNVMGTVHLLEAIRSSKTVKAVVIVTSDKCYENREWEWGYRENEAMGGYDPYSSSKGCAELVTAAFRKSFFNPEHYQDHGIAVASARAGNVIGGGDWSEDRLVPDIIKNLVNNSSPLIRNPQAIRPWQHVLEPLSGYLLLAQKLYEEGPFFSDAWNFGPNDEDAKPVEWIVSRLTQSWDKSFSWKKDDTTSPHEAHYLKLDNSKAKAKLNWHPRWNIEKAVHNTLSWYKNYYNKQDMTDFTLSQIHDYIQGLAND